MLRVGQFDSSKETGDWRKTHRVIETGDRTAWVMISSVAHKHFSLTVTEGLRLTGEEREEVDKKRGSQKVRNLGKKKS